MLLDGQGVPFYARVNLLTLGVSKPYTIRARDITSSSVAPNLQIQRSRLVLLGCSYRIGWATPTIDTAGFELRWATNGGKRWYGSPEDYVFKTILRRTNHIATAGASEGAITPLFCFGSAGADNVATDPGTPTPVTTNTEADALQVWNLAGALTVGEVEVWGMLVDSEMRGGRFGGPTSTPTSPATTTPWSPALHFGSPEGYPTP